MSQRSGQLFFQEVDTSCKLIFAMKKHGDTYSLKQGLQQCYGEWTETREIIIYIQNYGFSIDGLHLYSLFRNNIIYYYCWKI